MSRREFTKAVKVQIIKRAKNSHPTFIFCEECGSICQTFEIDHTIADALHIDKSSPLTAEDGRLLCPACHKEKTREDVESIAKAKRREAAHLGARREKQPIKSDADTLKSRHRPKHEGRTSLPPRPMFVDQRIAKDNVA